MVRQVGCLSLGVVALGLFFVLSGSVVADAIIVGVSFGAGTVVFAAVAPAYSDDPRRVVLGVLAGLAAGLVALVALVRLAGTIHNYGSR